MRIPKLRRNGDGRAFSEIPRSGGKRVYFGKYGTPESEARHEAWALRLLDGDPDALRSPGSLLSVVEVVESYLHRAKIYYSSEGEPTGEHKAMKAALLRFGELYGDVVASALGPRELRQFRDTLSRRRFTRGKAELVPSRGHVNKQLARVKRFIRWGENEGKLPEGLYARCQAVEPLKRGRSAARETKPVLPVSWAVLQKTLPFMSETVRDMTRVQFLCGMRPQEVILMRWADIEKGHVIKGPDGREVPVWFYRPSSHKNAWRDQGLVKAVPPSAQEILRTYDHRTSDAFLFSPREEMARHVESMTKNAKPERRRQAVAESLRKRYGESYSNQTYYHSVRDAIGKANAAGVSVPHWSPNQLRHGIATLIRGSLGADKSQAYLGHKSLDATEIYAHVELADLGRIAAAVDGLVRGEGRADSAA